MVTAHIGFHPIAGVRVFGAKTEGLWEGNLAAKKCLHLRKLPLGRGRVQ